MFDDAGGGETHSAVPPLESLQSMLTGLWSMESVGDDAERVEQLALLEQVKSAAAGAQAAVSVALSDSLLAKDDADGVAKDRRGRGIGALIGFARSESPRLGGRRLHMARTLIGDLPHTYAALRAGELSEWRASIVVTETAMLSPELRRAADAEIVDHFAKSGDRKLRAAARAAAYRLDPAAAVARNAAAEKDRRVSIRPAPDTMVWLSALLPVAAGVAAYAALEKHAKAARAAGDERTRGQVMADTLVERITGQSSAEAVPVDIGLIMDAETMFAGADRPATLAGYGPIPAELARRLAAGRAGQDDAGGAAKARARIRRLFTHPTDGSLVRMDSRRRFFEGELRDLIVLRDQTCRTPFCDAPIRHVDHPVPVRSGGATTATNGQGLCEQCNYTKEARGWRTEVVDDGTSGSPHTVRTVLPTGHDYYSTAPPPLPPDGDELLCRRLRRIIDTHWQTPPARILTGTDG